MTETGGFLIKHSALHFYFKILTYLTCFTYAYATQTNKMFRKYMFLDLSIKIDALHFHSCCHPLLPPAPRAAPLRRAAHRPDGSHGFHLLRPGGGRRRSRRRGRRTSLDYLMSRSISLKTRSRVFLKWRTN